MHPHYQPLLSGFIATLLRAMLVTNYLEEILPLLIFVISKNWCQARRHALCCLACTSILTLHLWCSKDVGDNGGSEWLTEVYQMNQYWRVFMALHQMVVVDPDTPAAHLLSGQLVLTQGFSSPKESSSPEEPLLLLLLAGS